MGSFWKTNPPEATIRPFLSANKAVFGFVSGDEAISRQLESWGKTSPIPTGGTPVLRGRAESQCALTGGVGAGMMSVVVVTLRVLRPT